MKSFLIIFSFVALTAVGITAAVAQKDEKAEAISLKPQQTFGQVVEPSESGAASDLIGGVVPHHDLVSHDIERFWQSLADTNSPKVILLIGPDHHDRGIAPVTTTDQEQVFTHSITLEKNIISQLIMDSDIQSDPNVFVGEHSVDLHLPYVQRFFPDASIVPILIRSDASQEQITTLAHRLRKLIPQKTMLVASVDFSHGQSREEAEQFDAESIAAIQRFDYAKMSRFGPEHTDSEQSIMLMSEAVCPSRACQWHTLFHGNSADLPYVNPKATTSYFSLFLFTKRG